MNHNTRLRYISSKNPEKILEYLNSLIAYKVEVKGNPTFVKGKWYLWFVLPESNIKEAPFGDID
jgi:hypothetical protein